MTDSRQKVLQQIDANKDKSLKFLQKIVSIPSVTGDEGAIQKYLADYLSKMGLEVDMWETDWEALKKHPGYIPVDRGYEGRPNIVATWKGTGGGKSLLFNGHTDVIPVGNGEGWSDDPWSATIKDGNLYGRGSCDMKSGVASHIMAIGSTATARCQSGMARGLEASRQTTAAEGRGFLVAAGAPAGLT